METARHHPSLTQVAIEIASFYVCLSLMSSAQDGDRNKIWAYGDHNKIQAHKDYDKIQVYCTGMTTRFGRRLKNVSNKNISNNIHIAESPVESPAYAEQGKSPMSPS